LYPTNSVLSISPHSDVVLNIYQKENSMTNKMTTKDAARIQSTQAPKTGGKTLPKSFPARAQKAADKNK